MTGAQRDANHPVPAPPTGAAGRRVVEEILRHGPASRSDLAARLDLSAATLTRVSAPLIAGGLLRELHEPRSSATPRAGRPSRPLDVCADLFGLVGVNLTGSAATVVRTGPRAEVLQQARAELAGSTPEAVVATVARLVAEVAPEPGDAVLAGVSLGGLVEGDVVVSAPFLGWQNVPLRAMVEAATGLQVVVDNDLVALTKAEHWFGPSRSLSRFAVVTLGAGVGYGLVVHDEVVTAPDAGLGPLGHLPLGVAPGEGATARCPLGHRDCAHALLARVSPQEETPERARALGRLVGVVCSTTMTTHVVVTGEGVGLAQHFPDDVDAGVRSVRDPRAEPVTLSVRPVDFGYYARGAAASALLAWLAGEVDLASPTGQGTSDQMVPRTWAEPATPTTRSPVASGDEG